MTLGIPAESIFLVLASRKARRPIAERSQTAGLAGQCTTAITRHSLATIPKRTVFPIPAVAIDAAPLMIVTADNSAWISLCGGRESGSQVYPVTTMQPGV